MIKAFQARDKPERGAWILYGEQPLESASHASAVNAASWPSVRADLAVWGQVYQFEEGAVLQLSLSLTPLLAKRHVRPEVWQVELLGSDGPLTIKKGLPSEYYEFEPLVLSRDAIVQFKDPQGIALYSSRYGGHRIGALHEVMRFYEIHEDAMLIATGGKRGWVRMHSISNVESETIHFCKGMVRLLRGDYAGARKSFSAVLEIPLVPQRLRTHSLIYLGLARELAGYNGSGQFEQAYKLNRLDKDAASYLLMSKLANISRLQQGAEEMLVTEIGKFKRLLRSLQVLYAKDDSWFNNLKSMANQLH